LPLNLVDPIIQSILIGSFYTLMGLGVTMVYAVTKIFNFAHGELMTIGSYVTALLTSFYGVNLAIGVLASLVFSGAIAVIMSELVFEPLIKRKAKLLQIFIASIGVGFIIRNIIYMIMVPRGLFFVQSRIPVQPVFYLGGVAVTNVFLYVVPTTIGLVALLHIMLTRTKLGRSMRAVADNPELAGVVGVRAKNVRRLTWFVSGALAGIAGALWAVYLVAYPEVGWTNLLSAFTASFIGGLISFSGTIVGGYFVGFGENLAMTLLNTYLGVDVGYKLLVTFVILVSVMLFKPTGLSELSISSLRELLSRESPGE
jgi:branched-chain amino acid transport system permease protein